MSAILPIAEDQRWRRYTASAGQTVFSIPFVFQDNADIAVTRIDATTGARTALAEPADMDITGAGNSGGGQVTLAAGAAAGDIYEILGDANMARTVSVVRAGRYSSSAIDTDIDRNRIIAQEQRREASRALKLDLGASAPAAGHFPIFDANGNMADGGGAADIQNAQAYAAAAAASAAEAALHDGVWIDDVATLLADAGLTYTADQNGTVTAGDPITTRKDGYRYTVAAAGASDHHVTTAGGVKLYVNVPAGGAVDVAAFGAIGDGATDDTAAIQKAIDFTFTAGGRVELVAKVFAVTGLKVYGVLADDGAGTALSGRATHLRGVGGAVLKMTAATGFVVQTCESPDQTLPTNEVIYGVLEDLIIDMDSKGHVGIMLQCAHHWHAIRPDIRNVPAGTFSYDDGHASGAQTYDKGGIFLKGITDVAGSFHNRISSAFIRGASSGTKGEVGIWFGTTQGQNNQRANFNLVEQGAYCYLETGIDIEQGFNQQIDMPDLFSNTDCIRVNTARNWIIKPYLESSTRGAWFTSNSGYNALMGLSSVASTTTPVDDDGVDNVMFPENNLPRYATISQNGGMGNQAVANNTWTKIAFDSITDDHRGMTDVANDRLKIDSNGDGEGQYLIVGTVRMAVLDGKRYELAIYKNGAAIYPQGHHVPGAATTIDMQVFCYVYLVKDDYIELWLRHNDGASNDVLAGIHTQLHAVKQVSHINKPFNR